MFDVSDVIPLSHLAIGTSIIAHCYYTTLLSVARHAGIY